LSLLLKEAGWAVLGPKPILLDGEKLEAGIILTADNAQNAPMAMRSGTWRYGGLAILTKGEVRDGETPANALMTVLSYCGFSSVRSSQPNMNNIIVLVVGQNIW